jgi:hypothetical protein
VHRSRALCSRHSGATGPAVFDIVTLTQMVHRSLTRSPFTDR